MGDQHLLRRIPSGDLMMQAFAYTCPGCGETTKSVATLPPGQTPEIMDGLCISCLVSKMGRTMDTPRSYKVNEIYLSIQGEGMRAGTVNVFVRFTGCNMRCDLDAGPFSPGGFACDTEFVSGRQMTAEEIVEEADRLWVGGGEKAVIFTGGEPGLQVDDELLAEFDGWYRAIETNGTVDLTVKCGQLAPESLWPYRLEWITLSPKIAEHAMKCKWASEAKYVRGYGQGVIKPRPNAVHLLISPAMNGDQFDRESMEWCKKLVLENPEWRLTTQLHKLWMAR